MPNRYLLAIAVASVTATYSVPAHAQWSPLSRDVQEEVGSSEKAPELEEFHKVREQLDVQQAAEAKQQKKGKGLLGRFHKSKAAPAGEEAAEEAAPAEEKATVPVGEEPGTAPAKELMEDETADKGDGDEDSDEDAKEKPKKAKEVPGAKPTEDTEDSDYFVKRAMSFANDKDFQSALNYVEKALQLQPQNWNAWYTKALVYQLAGYDAAAARRYLKLLEHRPDMLEAHIGMGMLYRKHNNYDLAQKEYEEAISLKYFNFPAHYNLANLLMDQKKYQAAQKEYQQCLKLQPNNALVHNNMGVIFQSRNYLEEAAQEFQKAANLEPANTMFVQNLTAVKQQIAKKNGKSPVAM